MVQAIKMAWAEESKQGRRFTLAAAPRFRAQKGKANGQLSGGGLVEVTRGEAR
jgi:hypothetical protein